MLSSNIYQKRLQDLADNIAKDMELLKDFEDELRDTTDPRLKARYRREIERQQESVTKYQQEFDELQQKLRSSPSAQIQVQKVGSLLQQMDGKLNVLLSGQVAIYENLNQMRQALLNRYEVAEQTMIVAIAEQLNQSQLLLTQKLLDAIETNQVSELEMQQMLTVLEAHIPALPPSQAAVADIIKDPELDARHRLKVTLPIVPLLVEYEGEFELGSGFNIKSAWEQLIAKLRRK
jgi:hypothetical protein